MAAASIRRDTRSLRGMCVTCTLAVLTLMVSSVAICDEVPQPEVGGRAHCGRLTLSPHSRGIRLDVSVKPDSAIVMAS
jgi:hypothetical protein